jgi:hypothetical protein
MPKRRKIGDADASRLSDLLTELAKKISNSLGDSGERATEVPGLMLYRRTAPAVPNPSTYDPSFLSLRKEGFEWTSVKRATFSAHRNFCLRLWNCRL